MSGGVGFEEELWRTYATAVRGSVAQNTLAAFQFACEAHDGQERKYTGEPYIWHPVRVAILTAQSMGWPWVIVALLHDVVEDCGVSLLEIDNGFGETVAGYVASLSDKPHSFGNRAKRQAEKVNRLSLAHPCVQKIKYADWLDNWPSIRDNDPDFAKVYRREVVECLVEMDAMSPLLEQLVMELGPDDD